MQNYRHAPVYTSTLHADLKVGTVFSSSYNQFDGFTTIYILENFLKTELQNSERYFQITCITESSSQFYVIIKSVYYFLKDCTFHFSKRYDSQHLCREFIKRDTMWSHWAMRLRQRSRPLCKMERSSTLRRIHTSPAKKIRDKDRDKLGLSRATLEIYSRISFNFPLYI